MVFVFIKSIQYLLDFTPWRRVNCGELHPFFSIALTDHILSSSHDI